MRQPGSLRRTSSVDVFFPGGQGKNLLLLGRARDIATRAAGGAPITLAEDQYRVELRPDRRIAGIEAVPARPALARLIGKSGSLWFRSQLAQAVPEERDSASPLYLILDDIPGASLVADWAWSPWDAGWLTHALDLASGPDGPPNIAKQEGVCIAHAPGSTALQPGAAADTGGTKVPDLPHPRDLAGWHEFPVQQGVGFRRARRIDIVLDDMIRVDSAFQDSANTPQGGRVAVHEYQLSITADPVSRRLRSIHAEPRILPYPECPAATARLAGLIDMPLAELRDRVPAGLRGVAGCTHLNDALRALAAVPALLDRFGQP